MGPKSTQALSLGAVDSKPMSLGGSLPSQLAGSWFTKKLSVQGPQIVLLVASREITRHGHPPAVFESQV